MHNNTHLLDSLEPQYVSRDDYESPYEEEGNIFPPDSYQGTYYAAMHTPSYGRSEYF